MLLHYTVPKFEGKIPATKQELRKYLPLLLAIVFCMNCYHNDIRLPNIVLAETCEFPLVEDYIYPPENRESIKQNLPLALIDFEYAGVDPELIEHLTHYQELSKINRDNKLGLELTNELYINIYSCLQAAGLLKEHIDIKYSGNGFTCPEGQSSTDVVTAANAWIDALFKVLNKDKKKSSITPGQLFTLYLQKTNTTSTKRTKPKPTRNKKK